MTVSKQSAKRAKM